MFFSLLQTPAQLTIVSTCLLSAWLGIVSVVFGISQDNLN
jgi:hypothetical protein